MDRDIRTSAAFLEGEALFAAACRPGEAFVSDIADLQLAPDASRLLFTGTLVENLNTPGPTRICAVDLDTGAIRTLTSGPNSDRHARTSPDGTTIAFLSDRDGAADYQLFFLDPQTCAVSPGPRVEGWVESLAWSPDGRRILLGVAGHGADLSSGQGAYRTDAVDDGLPGWMPQITGASADALWRKAWILDVGGGEASCVPIAMNIWEATWCGNDRLAVVASKDPDEGAWYGAGLSLIDLTTGGTTRLYEPEYQIGLPRASPSGQCLAFVEAVASDRGFVAGELRLRELRDGTCRLLVTDGVDVTCIEWRSDELLLVAGHRSPETVVLLINVATGTHTELWTSTPATASGDYATILGLDRPDAFAFVRESFLDSPRIATVQGGTIRIAEAAMPDAVPNYDPTHVEPVRWQAPDGLEIEGWLLRPTTGEPPYPTILYIHDGPVFHWRPRWLGRAPAETMLLRRGYALFLPNPRGSSGRGMAFAARVIGDIGGADTGDFLSGIDHLVAAGIADPARLGVTGLSYGGLMTCWLTTQDTRFKAAIAVGPATNHVSHHLTCNIPQFVSLFLADHYTNLAGAYYSRSPILHARKSQTPTMLVCGGLDRCTPPGEAIQFHNALLENGVESIVVEYPQEGHGVRGMSAAIDFAARCVMWFERHIKATRP